MRKVWIEVALNGAWSRKLQPRIPDTVEGNGTVYVATRYDVAIHVRLVLPMAIRVPSFFEQVNPLWPPYLLRDTMRIAEYLGVPFGWPMPDPIVQEWPSRRVA